MTPARRGGVRAALLLICLALVPGSLVGRAQGQDVGTPVAVAGPRQPGAVYLALGDSVAAGVGASRPSERGYAAVLAGYLDRQVGQPVQRLHEAVPGETTASLLAGPQLTDALRSVAAARRAGLRVSPITVTVGANDLLRADDDPAARAAALRGVAANLRHLLARLRAATTDEKGRPTADLVVTGYYDPTGAGPNLRGTAGWWLAQLDVVIEREARRAAATWVDVAAVVRGREAELTWYPSDIHPTNDGHRAIADAVWQALGYDAQPPAIRIERPAPGLLARPVPTVLAIVDDRVGVTEVSLAVDGVPVGALPYLPEVAAYAGLWDARSVPPGPHTIEVRARDAAGNATAASVVVGVPPASGSAAGGGTPLAGNATPRTGAD